jgi:hypothetical protein
MGEKKSNLNGINFSAAVFEIIMWHLTWKGLTFPMVGKD